MSSPPASTADSGATTAPSSAPAPAGSGKPCSARTTWLASASGWPSWPPPTSSSGCTPVGCTGQRLNRSYPSPSGPVEESLRPAMSPAMSCGSHPVHRARRGCCLPYFQEGQHSAGGFEPGQSTGGQLCQVARDRPLLPQVACPNRTMTYFDEMALWHDTGQL